MKAPPKVSERKLPGDSYTHHEYGQKFRLWVPASLQKQSLSFYGNPQSSCEILIGSVKLTLRHRSRTIHGLVPDSWLIDLNADSACVEEQVSE